MHLTLAISNRILRVEDAANYLLAYLFYEL